MLPIDLEKLSRTRSYDGSSVIVSRAGIALVLYSHAELPAVMRATANVLLAYLDFVPPNAIAAKYQSGPDEYTPGRWIAFDPATRAVLHTELWSGAVSPEDEGHGFELIATSDGQAGHYGVKFGGINFATSEDEGNETSILRLEFPWNLRDMVDVASFLDFIDRVAALFPFCCGHAGFSFTYTLAFVPEAQKEIDKLLPRFLGFDTGHTSMQLDMRGKSPPAHWINLLDLDLLKVVGGEEMLCSALEGCEVKRLESGLRIRAAKFPPVVDVNRGGLDLGCLPTVAKALIPVRFDKGLFCGLKDAESGKAWLQRFDNFAPRDWDNG